MDYLDPRKERRHHIILMVGYVLIAVGIILSTILLMDLSIGYERDKNGDVIQNGIVFFSSHPSPAQIRLNGVLNKSTTNTRLFLPSNIYSVDLSRSGYRDWQRKVTIDGGNVIHYDYPFLIPKTLVSSPVTNYSGTPGLLTQSPDRRWLLIQSPANNLVYDEFDLKASQITPVQITLPSSLLTKGATGSWQAVEWADDNRHVLLLHSFDGGSEYILFNLDAPDQSVNLNTHLDLSPTKILLKDKKYDQYYVYTAADATLASANLKATTLEPLLTHVLSFQSYGSDSLLYMTDSDAPTGKVLLKLKNGNQTYIIHSYTANTSYVLDFTKYSGVLYVVAGASSENKVYVFKDPIAQLIAQPTHAVVPIQVLHLQSPDYVSFSASAQFVVAEHGSQFGVFDFENKDGYSYVDTNQLDAPQQHTSWMDGDRLLQISSGKLVMSDYDDTNSQILMAASPDYPVAFTPDFKYVFALSPSSASGQFDLKRTALLAPNDL